MKSFLAAFFAALVFGVGLGMAGMTLPSKVLGFLDVTGNWDPSLAFVMVGAIGIFAPSYHLIVRRKRPVLSASFQLPVKQAIDVRLILGAVIFGVGWGLAGFCPGPAIVSSISGAGSVLAFLGSMVAGIYLCHFACPSLRSESREKS